MKEQLVFILILAGACQGINKKDEALRLIPQNEIIDRIRSNDFDYSYALFKGRKGGELTPEERSLLNQGKLARDYYENGEGIIREVIVRSPVLADKFFDIQMRAASDNPLASVEFVDINCNNLDSIFQEVRASDQQVRTEGGDMDETDSKNRQIVISTISKCGWSEPHLETIWLIFQHSPSELMAYYYPQLKQFSEEGKLSKGSIALMEDRLLMNNGHKQIYGSQISNGILYDLEDPDSVNLRREKMHLEPIQDYISRFGLDWEKEKTRMKASTDSQ
ncbi:MAG: hypothetical protein RIM99_14780 [Cyclobacteriaceae bacterium]